MAFLTSLLVIQPIVILIYLITTLSEFQAFLSGVLQINNHLIIKTLTFSHVTQLTDIIF